MKKEKQLNKYQTHYSDERFHQKLIKVAQKSGIKVVYSVLLLYYTLKKPKVPKWAKTSIVGALGYFIVPFDVIIDIAPIAGYTDDLGILGLALVTVALYVDDNVKNKAKARLNTWFNDYQLDEITEIDYQLEESIKKSKRG